MSYYLYRSANDKDWDALKRLASENGKTISELSLAQKNAAKEKDFQTARYFSDVLKHHQSMDKAIAWIKFNNFTGEGNLPRPSEELIPFIEMADYIIFDRDIER